MGKEKIFNSLVKNALDFLSRAIDEIEEFPKYSVINFYSAVELFLKARLMSEHWSLVVTKRQDPDLDKFLSGDFQSVTLDESANRLNKIVKSGITKEEHDIFRKIGNHRNKMVHFFHEMHSEEEKNALKQEIVKEQLRAWHFLNRLLTNKWGEIFSPWRSEITQINMRLKQLHEFLNVVYENIIEDINKQKSEGTIFIQCSSCGFESCKIKPLNDLFSDFKCLVCDWHEQKLLFECDGCNNSVYLPLDDSTICEHCNKEFDKNDVIDLIDEFSSHYHSKDGYDHQPGNCSFCDGYHTVISAKGQYLCVECFETFDSLSVCDWCNEPNTGDMEGSYFSGCNFCDGQSGWIKDD